MSPVHVRIFYPADPLGVVPGGINTFLRGLIKFAPPDLDFSLVGMTTDRQMRPLARWTRCQLGQRQFNFYPAVAVANPGSRGVLPLSLRFTASVWRRREALRSGFDIFDFHRLEPSLLFGADRRPKNAFIHQDPNTLCAEQSDNLWKNLPGAYLAIERRAMLCMSSVWCVRETGAQTLRERYPTLAHQTRFIPTWVDSEVFYELGEAPRQAKRQALATELDLDARAPWVVTVGRLDTTKDPALMLASLARLHARGCRVAWLVVGDGVLRPELERAVAAAGLKPWVRFMGLRSPPEIAGVLRACDAYALTSAYESMPMALLEAMGCGLPAAVTDVGEVRRVVKPGLNGAIAAAREPVAFAQALGDVLLNAAAWRGAPARDAALVYQPSLVLGPVYDNYRALGEVPHRLRLAASLSQRTEEGARRQQREVIGVPIDLISRSDAGRNIVKWAHSRQSRYVCFVNVHSAMQASRDERHRLALLAADLVTADGAPIAKTLSVKTGRSQERVDGPGMMWRLCGDAQTAGLKVGLYGSTPATLAALRDKLHGVYPRLDIAYAMSPQFRPLTAREQDDICEAISAAGVQILFVSLGCPKQEDWMACHRGRLATVMLGVGAAFDFHANTLTRAPLWMRESGLEWLHRLSQQPGRLWRRYLFTNSAFMLKSAGEILSTGIALPRRGHKPRRIWHAAAPLEHDDHATGPTLAPRAIEDLVRSVDTLLADRRPRVIGFIASGRAEGTSTLARAYVRSAAMLRPHRVLLVKTDASPTAGRAVLQALLSQRSLEGLIRPLEGGGATLSLGNSSDPTLRELLSLALLWQTLRKCYDEVVLDLPASSTSHVGLSAAAQCDGVVVVVEAEKTRAPVVEHLVANLFAVHANVLGTVLNRRRYHLPSSVYRWL